MAAIVIGATGKTHAQSSHARCGRRLFGRIGIGADMTMYYVPLMLQESYGAPVSFHAFIRYRFGTAPGTAEHHH